MPASNAPGFALPAGVQAANLRHIAPRPQASSIDGPPLFGTPLVQQAPSWDELRWLRAHTRLPLIVEGVLHPAQARQLVDAGVDALVVSNHGGRVLDGVVSPAGSAARHRPGGACAAAAG